MNLRCARVIPVVAEKDVCRCPGGFVTSTSLRSYTQLGCCAHDGRLDGDRLKTLFKVSIQRIKV